MIQSIGLQYTLSKDGSSYIVSGIGTCTDTSIVIPSTYNGKPVTKIGGGVFDGCGNITNITIPNSVTQIGASAFRECKNLKSIGIPCGVKSISNLAFDGCTSLRVVMIPSSVEHISSYAFDNCKNIKIVYYQGTADKWNKISVGEGNTALTNATIRYVMDDESSVDGDVGYSKGLKYTLSKDGTYYEISGKGDCAETYIVIPSKYNNKPVKKIGDSAFYSQDIQHIKIPEGVTELGNYAFKNCDSLASITLPSTLASIGREVFHDCRKLKSIVIPSGVKSIGYKAFCGCWKLFNIKILSGLISIDSHAFCCCYNLTSVTIPSSVKNIGYQAFMYCQKLASVYYGGSEEQWNQIAMSWGNFALFKANIKYNIEDDADEVNCDESDEIMPADMVVTDEDDSAPDAEEDTDIRTWKQEIEQLKQPIPAEEYTDSIVENPVVITKMQLQGYYLELTFSQKVNPIWIDAFRKLYGEITKEYGELVKSYNDKSFEKDVLSHVLHIFQDFGIEKYGIRALVNYDALKLPEIKQVIKQFVAGIQSVLKKMPSAYIALKQAPLIADREAKIKDLEAKIQQAQLVVSINNMLDEILSTPTDDTNN